MKFSKKIHSKNERKGNHMSKLKKWIGNLKVAAKLKVYRTSVLVMTAFFVLVALVSTLVIRSNIRHITEVWSPSLEYLQELETPYSRAIR